MEIKYKRVAKHIGKWPPATNKIYAFVQTNEEGQIKFINNRIVRSYQMNPLKNIRTCFNYIFRMYNLYDYIHTKWLINRLFCVFVFFFLLLLLTNLCPSTHINRLRGRDYNCINNFINRININSDTHDNCVAAAAAKRMHLFSILNVLVITLSVLRSCRFRWKQLPAGR